MSSGVAELEPAGLRASGGAARRRVLDSPRLRRAWLPGAVAGSRVIVLAAAVTAATASGRAPAWTRYDPTRLTTSFGALGNALAAPAVRWDAVHYLGIAAHGYAHPADASFFPLYPLLIRGLGALIGSPPVAGVLISLAAWGVALVLLHRLTSELLGRPAADATVLLMAFLPESLFFSAVYTESLFLALSVGCMLAARRERWALAGLLGGLAALTRVTGVLLALPLAVLHLECHRRPTRSLAWVLLVPAGLGLFLGAMALRGFGPLAPFLQEAGYHRTSVGPLSTLTTGVRWAASGLGAMVGGYSPVLARGPSVQALSVVLVAAAAVCGIALLAAVRQLPRALAAYAGAALAVCLWSTFADQPLASFDRYAMTVFPLAMVAGAWLARRRLTLPFVLVSGPLLAVWAAAFGAWTFVA